MAARSRAGSTAWANAIVGSGLFARYCAVSHPSGFGLDNGGYGAGFLAVGSGNDASVANYAFIDDNSDEGAGMAFNAVGPALVTNAFA